MSIKNPPLKRICRLSTRVRLGVAAVSACFFAVPLLAAPPVPSTTLPTNLTNLVGIDAKNIAYGANSLDIVTSAARSAADVANFNIAAGYRVGITQPSASANVLFRVLSNDPSVIYGSLTSNGGVFLVNPSGLFVGSGGQIDVARFVATTLGISNADFLADRKIFLNDGTAKDVINQGEIRTPAGGSVYLIGSNVSNEGIITTPRGETILAAGSTVTLIDSALPGVKVDITGAAGNATNLGTVTAEAGRIGIAGVIVRNSGALNASSVVADGGRIFLKATGDVLVEGGKVEATSASGKGGQVDVLGDRVAVMNDVGIDVTGATGGGKIRVGGDYQGKNPDIRNASITYVGPNASLKADASEVGDGGTVIVWADDTTRAYGSISAKGGANGGNGGFIETSGHRYLDVAGARVSAAAAKGAAGQWLLDPNDIKIFHGISSGDSQINGSSPFAPTQSDASVSLLSDDTINTAINGGTSVTIQTTSSGSGTGDIIFDGTAGAGGPIIIDHTAAAATILNLNATNDIRFKGTTTFQTTGGSTGLTVKLNPGGASGKVKSDFSDLAVVNLVGTAGHMEVQLNGGGKTWENDGTINLSGDSTIRIFDSGSTVHSTFWNKTFGTVNLNTTPGWSFLSLSGPTQEGVIINDCTINVNTSTSWEARYSQGAGGILNINGSASLSMQHLDVAAGAINLNSSASYALTLFEQHAGLSKFDGASIVGFSGPRRIQIGTSAGGSNTTTFNNVSTSGGVEILVPELGTLNFTGANTFTDTKFYKGDSGANNSWVIPVATYLGNVEWWAMGNISFANDVTFGGSVKMGAGWDANIGTPGVTPGSGSIQVTDKQVVSGGAMTLMAGGDILVKRTAAGSTSRLESGAGMTADVWGDLNLLNQGNPGGGNVELKSAGNQSIDLKGASSNLVVEASGGGLGGGFTSLKSDGTQTINFSAAGGHTLVVTGGMVGTSSSAGAMASIESTGAQTILNSGTLAINLTGGNVLLNTQNQYEDFGLPSQRTVCTSCSTQNSAQIRSKSTQNIAASTITIIGGSGGNGNSANIDAKGTSNVVVSGLVSITGGSSGGLYVGGVNDDYVSNDAGIGADGALSLTAGSIVLNGGSAAYGGAYIGGGSSVTVTTTGTGNLTLTGGSTAAQGAALTYADASPATLKWLAPAVIGSDAGSLTNITLNVGGDLTLTGGAMGQAGGSMAMIGGAKNTPVNLTINSRAITLNSANALADRIGSMSGGTVALHSGVGGTGSMALGQGLISTGYGMGGSVLLDSTGTGPGIAQIANGMILTDSLNATATGAGAIDLLSLENRVGNFDATTSTGLVTFKAQNVGLGTINSGTGGAAITAQYDIHDNNGSAINITGPTVSLQSMFGGSAGALAISADVAATSSIVGIVTGGSTNGGIRIANTSPVQPTTVTLTDNGSTGASARFTQNFTGSGTLTASGTYVLTTTFPGAISLASNDGLDYNAATFNPGGNGSVVLAAAGLLNISGPLAVGATNNLGLFGNTVSIGAPVSGKNITLTGSTVNILATTTATADLLVGADALNINSIATAQNVIIAAENLNIGNTGGVLANNSLVAVVTGDANISGGYLKTSAADLEMIVGGDLNIGDAIYGGYIWAGYNKISPYFPDASIAVGGDLKLNNGASIQAANDVYLDLLGSASKLVINDGTAGYAQSYILSDIGTAVPATTHVAFLSRNSGGIVIDGKETSKTVVGGSGFFVVDPGLGTPASAGAGLDIAYASQLGDSVAAQLANALGSAADKASTSSSPTDSGAPPSPPEKQSSGDTSGDAADGSFGGGDSSSASGSGSDDGGKDGGADGGKGGGKDGKKDGKNKKSDQAKDGKKDEKSAKKPAGKCVA